MDVELAYTKKRSAFGRHCRLSTRPVEIVCEIKQDQGFAAEFVSRHLVDEASQTGNEHSEHAVNTVHIDLESRGVFHQEGGWPKDINPLEPDQVARYRKKTEKADTYTNTIKGLASVMETYILQNNAIDIYETFFPKAVDQVEREPPSARAVNRFSDPHEPKRPAANLSWFCDGPTKLAVAYSSTDFQSSFPTVNLESYIWDVENALRPELVLRPCSPIVCIEFHPKDPHLVLGGLYNGQIAFWDTRRSSSPCEVSIVDTGHREPACAALWIQSKAGNDCFSSSPDGQVLWWDVRKMDAPTESLLLDPTKRQDPLSVNGAMCLEYEPTIPTKFMAGTEEGGIICCNRKGKMVSEKVAHVYTGHIGPVYALQRSPFFPKNFLSAGDWRVRIWSEDCKESAIWWSRNLSAYLTDACWSPSRPAVFFVSKLDGTVDAWDLMHKHKDPVISLQVSDEPVHCVRIHDQGRLIAAGSGDGNVTLLDLSDSLSIMERNEKSQTLNMLDKESRREKLLKEQKVKTARTKQNRASDEEIARRIELTPEIEESIEKAEKAFFETIEAEKKKREREFQKMQKELALQERTTETLSEEKRDQDKTP